MMSITTVGTPIFSFTRGPEFQVNTVSGGEQVYHRVADLTSGFVSLWSSPGGSDGSYKIFGRLFNEQGQTSSPQFRIDDFPINLQIVPSAAALPSGFVVVWTGYNTPDQSGNSTVYGRSFAHAGTAIGPSFKVNTQALGGQADVITVLSGFAVAYVGDDGFDPGVFAQFFHANATRNGEEFRVNIQTAGAQYARRLAPVRDGFVSTWLGIDRMGHFDVFGRVFDGPSQARTEEFRVNNSTDGRQSGPDVTTWPGRMLCVWVSELQEENTGLYGQFFNENAAKIGLELRLDDLQYSKVQRPRVLAMDFGFVMVWQAEEESNSTEVLGQLFTHSGERIGTSFKLNDYSIDAQWDPEVAALSNGFAVVWESKGQDGDGNGLFGRVFTMTKTTTSTVRETASNFTSVLAFTSPPRATLGEISILSPVESDSMTTALIIVIVCLVLSLCTTLGLHLHNRQLKKARGANPEDLPSVPTEKDPHYQSVLPVQMQSTPADYDSFRVVEEENAKY